MVPTMADKEHKSIFVDTNVLAPLNLLFLTYDSLKISPASYFDNLSDLKNALGKKLPDIYDQKAIEIGFNAWRLINRTLENCEIDLYYSYLLDIEFRDILINHKFHEYLSREGFCYRVFKKRPLKNQVFFSYADDIESVCTEMYNRLNMLGINLIWCESNDESNIADEIAPMLKILSRYVFLDAMDAYFYCLAIRNFCSVFVTRDTEFFGVMENLSQGVDDEWKKLRDNIVNDLCSFLPVFNDFVNSGNSLLPVPINPKNNGGVI